MLSKCIQNIIKRVENRELNPHEATQLIELELRFEMKRKSCAGRFSTNLFI
jgi:hypothetical protein